MIVSGSPHTFGLLSRAPLAGSPYRDPAYGESAPGEPTPVLAKQSKSFSLLHGGRPSTWHGAFTKSRVLR